MIESPKAEVPVLDWAPYTYCALPVVEQLVWEERGDALTKSMLFLMYSKNNKAQKEQIWLIHKEIK